MRRGQAALEFLTTYGWAFLVILVMIGALAYFGVINPNQFLPERCTFQQEFTCEEALLDIDGANVDVRFFIRNNLGVSANSVVISAKYSGDTGTPTDCSGSPIASIGAGEIAEMVCDDIPPGTGSYPPAGDKAKFDLNGTYTPAGKQYERQLEGQIFGSLQE